MKSWIWTKNRLSWLCVLLVAAGMLAVPLTPSAALADDELVFADSNLAWSVRRSLGLGPLDPVYRSQAENVRELVADYTGGNPPGPPARINSLEGIQALVNLKVLSLQDNRVTDISPLGALGNLMDLNLRENRNISDLTPLRGLGNLKDLNLRRNKVWDLEPIAGLTGLESLNLRRNYEGTRPLTDVSPLKGMKGLTDLNVGENPGIAHEQYAVLQEFPLLEELGVRANAIQQIEGVTSPERHPLMEDLDLSENQIGDISILSGYRRLAKRLLLAGNPIVDYCPVASYYSRIEEKDFSLDPPLVEFSRPGGFYASEFDLELTAVNSQGLVPEALIYFTLDGSEPDRAEVSGEDGPTYCYTGPIKLRDRRGDPNVFSEINTTSPDWAPPVGELFKATPVRGRVYCDNGPWPSAVTTNTYFVDKDIEGRYNLPVISVTSDSDNFFDYLNGIYVMGKVYDENLNESVFWPWRPANYSQRGKEWERPVHFEFFEPGGGRGPSLDAGVRVHGGSSRAWQQKSLRLYFSRAYGSGNGLEYELFPGLKKPRSTEPLTTFRRFLLRNSGQDWSRNRNSTMFRDALCHSLLADTGIDVQAYRPAVVFLNGEYWGIHNIRERQDDWYLQTRYGGDNDDFVILGLWGAVEEGKPGDETPYLDLMKYISENDLSKDAHYDYVAARMDLDDLADYYAAEIYFDNIDWPHNNMEFWRYKRDDYDPDAPYGLDGRWRWLLQDIDGGFGYLGPGQYANDTLLRVLQAGEGPWAKAHAWATLPFRSLMKNPRFREGFVDRLLFHLRNTFETGRVLDKIDTISRELAPAMPEHLRRWACPGIDQWEKNVDVMRSFARERPAYVIYHLNKDLGLDIPNKTYRIEASAGQGGFISPSGAVEVSHGCEQAFTIKPDADHRIEKVVVDGAEITPPPSTYTFSTVTAGHNISASFALIKPEIASIDPASAPPGALATLNGAGFGALGSESRVDIGGHEAELVSWTDTKVRFKVPDRPPGTASVKVTNSRGQSDLKADFFTVSSPLSTWYLAEGSCAWGFSTYITVQNANSSALKATVTYMPTGRGNVTEVVELPANSQLTLTDDHLRQKMGGAFDFSTRVVCSEPTKPLAVDRTMEWTGPGALFPEGHSSVGVGAPASTWYLPEGSTRWGFETWLCIQNPNPGLATCQVTYMVEGEKPVVSAKTIPPNSRRSFNMFEDVGAEDASIKVTSDIPVIPERSMYRNNRRGGHCSIGATAPAPDYYLAEGTSAWGFTTYLVFQNPNDEPADVQVVYMTRGGAKPQEPFRIPPGSRKTVRVNDSPGMGNLDFSTRVHGSMPIIAERSMYWDNGTGEACHDSIGTPKPAMNFYLPDGETSRARETWTVVQNPNGVPVEVAITYLTPDGSGNVALTRTIPGNSRTSFNMAEAGIRGRAAVKVVCNTQGRPVVVERAMYWNARGAGTDTVGCSE